MCVYRYTRISLFSMSLFLVRAPVLPLYIYKVICLFEQYCIHDYDNLLNQPATQTAPKTGTHSLNF